MTHPSISLDIKPFGHPTVGGRRLLWGVQLCKCLNYPITCTNPSTYTLTPSQHTHHLALTSPQLPNRMYTQLPHIPGMPMVPDPPPPPASSGQVPWPFAGRPCLAKSSGPPHCDRVIHLMKEAMETIT